MTKPNHCSHDVDAEVPLLPDGALRLLQDPQAGPHGDADLLQAFLRDVGQLQHAYLLRLEEARVLLVAQAPQEDPHQGRLVPEELRELLHATRVGQPGVAPKGLAPTQTTLATRTA